MNILPVNLVATLAGLIAPLAALGEPAGLLRATPTSLSLENRRADAYDLSRMTNPAMVRRFARAGLLVGVPSRTDHYYLSNISSSLRYLRPWSRLFLDRLSRQYHARFRKPLRVTSLIRTATLQQRLTQRNGNAAPAYGPRRSSHLTGATLDISKKGMTRKELDWMRRVLFSLKSQDYLHAIEEFQQAAFHVMVFRNYPQYVMRAARRSPG
ncbi:MAG: hypothetical protein EHM65_09455 [Acidobacteriales bacterium]|nr:MAG: hypothetical protein EHM65_09455 [Terriglobales bacterium]